MKTTVVYHSADYDGIFCREIARKFLPDAELIGWDFKDSPISPPTEGVLYVMDLPIDRVFGFKFDELINDPTYASKNMIGGANVIWIDHHKSSIESHPKEIHGYRIDGVAACRLAWQWFTKEFKVPDDVIYSETQNGLPTKRMYSDRFVKEPLAVRLAGEYDVWDHRGDGDLEFQFGLDSQSSIPWSSLLRVCTEADTLANAIVSSGKMAMQCYAKRDADIMGERSFIIEWEGLKFLAITTARCNSNTFYAKDIPETGHDALMGFYYNGSKWIVSLYHAKHNTGIDLSQIAVKYGGGGHKGACGFQSSHLPFLII